MSRVPFPQFGLDGRISVVVRDADTVANRYVLDPGRYTDPNTWAPNDLSDQPDVIKKLAPIWWAANPGLVSIFKSADLVRAQGEKKEADAKAEADRVAAEEAEQKRLADEKAAAELAAAEKAAAEEAVAQAERDRIAAEQAAKEAEEKAAAEAKAAAEQAELDRIEAERAAEQAAKEAAEQAERDRIAAEEKAAADELAAKKAQEAQDARIKQLVDDRVAELLAQKEEPK